MTDCAISVFEIFQLKLIPIQFLISFQTVRDYRKGVLRRLERENQLHTWPFLGNFIVNIYLTFSIKDFHKKKWCIKLDPLEWKDFKCYPTRKTGSIRSVGLMTFFFMIHIDMIHIETVNFEGKYCIKNLQKNDREKEPQTLKHLFWIYNQRKGRYYYAVNVISSQNSTQERYNKCT